MKPLTKEDQAYYDAESDSIYFKEAKDPYNASMEEVVFMGYKVQEAYEGLLSGKMIFHYQTKECEGCAKDIADWMFFSEETELYCYWCWVKKWFPVFKQTDNGNYPNSEVSK